MTNVKKYLIIYEKNKNIDNCIETIKALEIKIKNDFYLKHNKVDPFGDIINSLEKLKEKLPNY